MRNKGKCVQNMRGHFGECGLRMTAAREAILDALSKIGEHSSAEEIYLATHKMYPRIGLTTVYRTLELLHKMGMIYKIEFGDGRARYELSEKTGDKEHHHHVVCTQCGKIINYNDFSETEVQAICGLQKELEKKYRFCIQHHSVQYYGTCYTCSGKK